MFVNKRPFIFGIIFGLLFVVAVAGGVWDNSPVQDATPETTQEPTQDAVVTDITLDETTALFDESITTNLNNLIAQQPGLEIAVSVIDLETGDQYNAGLADTSFKAASTAKLMTAASYLYEVQEGRASIDQTIDGVNAVNLIKQMLEVSDNAAWDSLRNFLGDKQQSFARLAGIESFVGGDTNTLTAADQAKFLATLYEGDILNSTLSAIIFEHMAQADAEELIKSAMPAETVVLHKYGTLWGNLHDTALVKYRGHSFALVIFTNDPTGSIQDYAVRASIIREIAQVVMLSFRETTPVSDS